MVQAIIQFCAAHTLLQTALKVFRKFGIKQRPTLKNDAVPTIFKRTREPPCSSEECSSNLLRSNETEPRKKGQHLRKEIDRK